MEKNDISHDLLTILADKDKEIELLKVSLRAHSIRTSNIQARLLTTLDALDLMQTSYNQDLELEREKCRNLKQNLYRCRKIVHECEIERDDMREAVNSLVEKVEASNNYALWSHSRMRISARVDPMDSTSPALGLGNDTDTDKLEYARALIHALVLERDLEKARRQQEFKIWKAKTAMLEAQLALREAELESCITHTRRCFEPQLAEELEIELDRMSVSDSTNILQLVGAKNRFLNVVNSDLSEQLRFLYTPSVCKVDASCQTEVTAQLESLEIEGHLEAVPSPATVVGEASNKTSDEKTSLLNIHPTSSLLEDFDREIRGLGYTIDAFEAEKAKMAELIHTENSRHTLPVHDDKSEESRLNTNILAAKGLSPHEHTHSGSNNIFDDAHVHTREVVEQAYTASLQREKSLIDENTRLLHLLHRLTRKLNRRKAESEAEAPEDPENDNQLPKKSDTSPVQLLDDGGEMTMDLGTPLVPTTIILPASEPDGRPSSPSPYVPAHTSPSGSSAAGRNASSTEDLIDVGAEFQFDQASKPVIFPASYSPSALSPSDFGYPQFSYSPSSQKANPHSEPDQTGLKITEFDIDDLETELEDAQNRLTEGEMTVNKANDALLNLEKMERPP